eukprot:TRINITY_DN11756_c0_g1_i1.p1 TRINITY_DN11756_c0_g1~~TRINITY_DN11756_c0_g1_i1.p1  ORF type:complete len:617 (-),score=156.79 TRINITY_DN11756_c0_g1_i1:67-1917(-)
MNYRLAVWVCSCLVAVYVVLIIAVQHSFRAQPESGLLYPQRFRSDGLQSNLATTTELSEPADARTNIDSFSSPSFSPNIYSSTPPPPPVLLVSSRSTPPSISSSSSSPSSSTTDKDIDISATRLDINNKIEKFASASSLPTTISSPSTSSSASVLPVDKNKNNIDVDMALDEAITRYAKLHHAQLDAYTHSPPDSINNHKDGRFMIVWPFGGLGNRMLAIMSGFLLALLTDRALLVNSKRMFPTSPINRDLFDMSRFNWELTSYPDIAKRFEEDYCKSAPDDVFYIPEDQFAFSSYRDLLACDDLFTKFDPYTVVSQSATQYTLPLLLHNPYFQEKLQRWGIDDSHDTFGRLARYLYRPVPSILSAVDQFYNEHMKQRTPSSSSSSFLRNDDGVQQQQRAPMIGVQFRTDNYFLSVNSAAMFECIDRLIDRMTSAWSQAQMQISSSSNTQQLSSASSIPEKHSNGNAPSSSSSPYRSSARIFLATDTEQMRTTALQHWGKDRVVFYPFSIEEQHNATYALMDMVTLSKCDALLTTSGSTFGWIARGFYGETRHDPNSIWMIRTRDCLLCETNQPCLHFSDSKPTYQLTKAKCYDEMHMEKEHPSLKYQVIVPGQCC